MNTIDQVIAETCRRIVSEGCDNVLIGPVVLDENDRSYFVLATGNLRGTANTEGLYARSRKDAETLRATMILAIMQRCGAIALHDFDDEFRMVQMAATLWPQRFVNVRQAMQQERGNADQR